MRLSKVESREIKSYHLMLLAIKGDAPMKKSLECLICSISSTKRWDPKSYTIFVVQSLHLNTESKILSVTVTYCAEVESPLCGINSPDDPKSI